MDRDAPPGQKGNRIDETQWLQGPDLALQLISLAPRAELQCGCGDDHRLLPEAFSAPPDLQIKFAAGSQDGTATWRNLARHGGTDSCFPPADPPARNTGFPW